MEWIDGCTNCKKKTEYQTGQVFNLKYGRHEIANWCSKACQEYPTLKICPTKHSFKTKKSCAGILDNIPCASKQEKT